MIHEFPVRRAFSWFCGLTSNQKQKSERRDQSAVFALSSPSRLSCDNSVNFQTAWFFVSPFAMTDFLFRCHRDYDGALHKVATARPSVPNDTAFFILSG